MSTSYLPLYLALNKSARFLKFSSRTGELLHINALNLAASPVAASVAGAVVASGAMVASGAAVAAGAAVASVDAVGLVALQAAKTPAARAAVPSAMVRKNRRRFSIPLGVSCSWLMDFFSLL